MRQAWREFMFAEVPLEKALPRKLKNGSRGHSFRTLLEDLSTNVRNTSMACVG